MVALPARSIPISPPVMCPQNANLNGTITLDTNGGAFSLFGQQFTPGSLLTFQLTTTENLTDDSINTPDAFALQILDSGGKPIGHPGPRWHRQPAKYYLCKPVA